MGVLVVGVVSMPFFFEGYVRVSTSFCVVYIHRCIDSPRRSKIAAAGLKELREHTDTMIVVPNQNLLAMMKTIDQETHTSMKDAFLLADQVLLTGVRSVTDLVVSPGEWCH